MELKPLPKTPTLPSSVGDGKGLIKSLYDHIITSNARMNQLITRAKELAGSVITHKETHATGGSDELTPADIGAMAIGDNAATATKLTTARTIALTGAITGSSTFDGSQDLSITTSEGTINNYDTDHSFSANGYQELSNGLIFQWGNITADGSYTFPIPFTTALLSLTFGSVGSISNGVPRATSTSLTGFTYRSANVANCPAKYIAIGY